MILTARNIEKSFGKNKVLDNINLEVKTGEIAALLGENGAGKSTFINILAGLSKFDKGEILLNGESIYKNLDSYKSILGLVPQEIALLDDLTGLENLKLFSSSYKIPKQKQKSKIEELIHQLELDEYIDQKVSTYSGGISRRLNLACSLVHEPKILILDEPTVAIDIKVRNIILEFITEKISPNAIVIYSSHYLEELEQIGSKIQIIKKGKILKTISKLEIVKLSQKYKSISLKFSSLSKDLLNNLAKRDDIIKYKLDANSITIIPDENFNLTEFLSKTSKKDEIIDIDIEKQNLESIYLELDKENI